MTYNIKRLFRKSQTLEFTEFEQNLKANHYEPGSKLDPSEVFKHFDLSPPHVALALEAITDVSKVLDFAVQGLPHFRPLTPIRWWDKFNIWRANEINDQVSWRYLHDADFNAGAKATGAASYEIILCYGAVIRTSSLCSEIAAVEIDGASGSQRPSILETWKSGHMYSAIPQSGNAKEYSKRLLKIVILFLFGHEFAHVIKGHCGYFYYTNPISDDDRRALESEADWVGGAAVGAWLAHNTLLLRELGWSSTPEDTQDSTHITDTCILAAIILFMMFDALTTTSRKYLSPSVRLNMFIGGTAGYLRAVNRLPYAAANIICADNFSESNFLSSVSRFTKILSATSMRGTISKLGFLESDMRDIDAAKKRLSELRPEIDKHVPFGMVDYVNSVRLTSGSPSQRKA